MDFGLLSKNGHSYWCRFPRARCSCGGKFLYERLHGPSEGGDGASSNYHYRRLFDDNVDRDFEEDMTFYNDDGSFQTVFVERNLCAVDLCQLLALKNRQPKDRDWAIVELWVDLGVERSLEDHEYVLGALRDLQSFALHANVKYFFRRDLKKYEFVHKDHIRRYFPSPIVTFYKIPTPTPGQPSNHDDATFSLIENECHFTWGYLWVRNETELTWSKSYIVLHHKRMYITRDVSAVQKLVQAIHNRMIELTEAECDILGVSIHILDVSKYVVYTCINAKNQLRAPVEWGICLRPCCSDTEEENTEIRCFGCDSEAARAIWVTGMRLAKYGKQLRENYRAFRNKQSEATAGTSRDFNAYSVPQESVRSRVAMDFTGSVGRIVDDPQEARAIELAEEFNWKRRWRPPTRAHNVRTSGVHTGIHLVQPWFHSGMTRDRATSLINQYGTVDGVFLVRDSRSHPGTFVLTYKSGKKVLHTPIILVEDPTISEGTWYFTLDGGQIKFYDLLQLVEFYQLNAGALQTKLTHFVVESSIALAAQSPEPAQQQQQQGQAAAAAGAATASVPPAQPSGASPSPKKKDKKGKARLEEPQPGPSRMEDPQPGPSSRPDPVPSNQPDDPQPGPSGRSA